MGGEVAGVFSAVVSGGAVELLTTRLSTGFGWTAVSLPMKLISFSAAVRSAYAPNHCASVIIVPLAFLRCFWLMLPCVILKEFAAVNDAIPCLFLISLSSSAHGGVMVGFLESSLGGLFLGNKGIAVEFGVFWGVDVGSEWSRFMQRAYSRHIYLQIFQS